MPTQIAEEIGTFDPPFRPSIAVTGAGHEIEFADLSYCLEDLFFFGWITPQEFYTQRFWISQYKNGLAMPGSTLFRCVYTGEQVSFPWWMEGVYCMWNLAGHWYDLEDQEADLATVFEEENDDDMATLAGMIIEIRPTNIGRFNMNPASYGRPIPTEVLMNDPVYAEFLN